MTESESRVCVGKTVSPDILTYLINLKDTLLEKYKRAHQGLALVKNGNNGRIDNIQEALDLVMKTLRKMVEKEMGVSKGIMELSDKQVLEEYLNS